MEKIGKKEQKEKQKTLRKIIIRYKSNGRAKIVRLVQVQEIDKKVAKQS